MLQLPVYLDYNATTPCDPAVVEAMLPYFSRHFGNAASRSHSFGWEAEEAVKFAREQVAALIGAEPGEIVFTSGATEAVNLAIKGVFEAYASRGRHIVTCVTEHRAVIDTCRYLEKQGAEVTWLPVHHDGRVTAEEVEAAMRPDTVLVAMMYANNETGTIMPVKEVGAVTRRHGILFFTDATQAAGKIPVDVNEDMVDLLAFSAHKMCGPKGAGALFVRRRNPRVKLLPLIHGGGHEKGMRSGTLNVPGIVGFGRACALSQQAMEQEGTRLAALRDRLEDALLSVGEVAVNAGTAHRLPHVSNLRFANADGEALLMAVNKNIAVSSGAACTSASLEPSHVLKALGISDELAHSSVRFSLGRFTQEEEIEYTIGEVTRAVAALREMSASWTNDHNFKTT
ncbi:MAG TPA: IscS subfamily cysteine desulfurase [Flavisolibacter sp.]